MDGKSFLPLLNRNRNIKDKWPDTFLIESSGRRDVPTDGSKQKGSGKHGSVIKELINLATTERSNVTDMDGVRNETTDTLIEKYLTGIDLGSHESDDEDDQKSDVEENLRRATSLEDYVIDHQETVQSGDSPEIRDEENCK